MKEKLESKDKHIIIKNGKICGILSDFTGWR